jgi:hypothetical protein
MDFSAQAGVTIVVTIGVTLVPAPFYGIVYQYSRLFSEDIFIFF